MWKVETYIIINTAILHCVRKSRHVKGNLQCYQKIDFYVSLQTDNSSCLYSGVLCSIWKKKSHQKSEGYE